MAQDTNTEITVRLPWSLHTKLLGLSLLTGRFMEPLVVQLLATHPLWEQARTKSSAMLDELEQTTQAPPPATPVVLVAPEPPAAPPPQPVALETPPQEVPLPTPQPIAPWQTVDKTPPVVCTKEPVLELDDLFAGIDTGQQWPTSNPQSADPLPIEADATGTGTQEPHQLALYDHPEGAPADETSTNRRRGPEGLQRIQTLLADTRPRTAEDIRTELNAQQGQHTLSLASVQGVLKTYPGMFKPMPNDTWTLAPVNADSMSIKIAILHQLADPARPIQRGDRLRKQIGIEYTQLSAALKDLQAEGAVERVIDPKLKAVSASCTSHHHWRCIKPNHLEFLEGLASQAKIAGKPTFNQPHTVAQFRRQLEDVQNVSLESAVDISVGATALIQPAPTDASDETLRKVLDSL